MHYHKFNILTFHCTPNGCGIRLLTILTYCAKQICILFCLPTLCDVCFR